MEEVRIRNPKIDNHIGEVVKENDNLDNLYLFDEKQIYIQVLVPEEQFSCVGRSNAECVHVIIREWNAQTWQIGKLYEVKVDKNLSASKF